MDDAKECVYDYIFILLTVNRVIRRRMSRRALERNAAERWFYQYGLMYPGH